MPVLYQCSGPACDVTERPSDRDWLILTTVDCQAEDLPPMLYCSERCLVSEMLGDTDAPDEIYDAARAALDRREAVA